MKKYTISIGLRAFFISGILIFVFLASSSIAIAKEKKPSFYINLQDFPLYYKQGFAASYITQPNIQDGSWHKKLPFSNVIVGELGLPDLPERMFLSPTGKPEQEFTFIIPFTVKALDELLLRPAPGMFLAGIGDNWEIYLNGHLVKSEMHLAKNSLTIQEHHSQRRVFFPLEKAQFKQGENLLVFRIVGDPTNKTVGFQYSAPFYITDYDYIAQEHDETLDIILIGGYLLVSMYHFFLFAIRRKDIHNFHCGMFSMLMGFYYLFRTHGIYHYIPDTLTVVKLEFFCIFLVIPALGTFAESLCQGKVSRVAKVYSTFFIFLAVSQLLFSHPYASDCLVVWQVTGIAVLLYLLINNMILAFIKEVKAEKKQYALWGRRSPSIAYFLTETYTGNLLISVSILIPSAIIDILDSLLFHSSLNVTRYCFYLFVITVTMMLARIYGKLNNALQARSIFLANMSHEIRTPMNAIMGMTEQILLDNPPEKTKERAGQIKQAGNILISIIEDILDFSRLEAGKMPIINRQYNFYGLMDEVTSIIKAALTGKNIQFVVETDHTIPPLLIGDALRIRQILLNLLWNAVKFTHKGLIIFRVERKDIEGQLVLVFSVADTGEGIKQEDLAAIFAEYYRLDSKGRPHAEGAGLGLTICKSLCHLMDGEISLESEYGRGSVFTVSLPQQIASEGRGLEQAKRTVALREQGVVLPRVLALIVDDLESNRQVIEGFLKPYGMVVHSAVSGRDALLKAACNDYHIVFMDHIMGNDMNGIVTTQALRKLDGYATTPVVVLTAHAVSGSREYFLENGFQDYISKPIDPVVLDEVLARWIPNTLYSYMPVANFVGGETTRAVGEGQAEAFEAAALELAEIKQIEPALMQDEGAGATAAQRDAVGAVQMELALQRLNLLNHYRWHFENSLETDSAYLIKLVELIEALLKTPVEFPALLQEKMRNIASAGRREDVSAIKAQITEVYANLAALLQKEKGSDQVVAREREHAEVYQILVQLKQALEAEDSIAVDALMVQLREISWPASFGGEMRELYFFLYDALMMEKTEQAAGALGLWCKLFGRG